MNKNASTPHIESKPRGRPRSPEIEAAILTATTELLATKSLREVTADAIAQRAGVSKATLYKWWPNKNLVALDAFLSIMRQNVDIPNTGSAFRDFKLELQSVLRFYVGPQGRLFREFIAEGQSDPEFLELFRRRFLASRHDDVRIIWERGVRRGEIRSDVDPDIGMDMIFGPLIARMLYGRGPLDDTSAEAVVALVFGGIQKAAA
ncbi:TetR/AcrR family transcriptional regulator [Pendulispora brunnea]|uniref:TetR/AcrR family transcriptional regulator n=1 Tax=Pendulispora brunnea TaxID=2905690 RepID=A0ABZ2KBJ7_9BACT